MLFHYVLEESESESHSVVSNSLRAHGLYSPLGSPGQNAGVGSLSLLQGIFPTQGLNPGLLHCGQILYQLSHKGSPRTLESNRGLLHCSWVLYRLSSLVEGSHKYWHRVFILLYKCNFIKMYYTKFTLCKSYVLFHIISCSSHLTLIMTLPGRYYLHFVAEKTGSER